MKTTLLILLWCFPCLAQLPVVPFVTQNNGPPIPTANLIIWADQKAGSKFYNSAHSSSPANNDKIGGYTDISGNHNDLTNTGSSTVFPVYQTAGGPSGIPYILFSTGSTGTGLSNFLNAVTFSQPNTFYFVWISNMGGVNETELDSSVPASANRNVYYFTTGGGGQRFMYASGNSAVIGGLDQTPWTVATLQFNGSSSLWRTNGVVGQSGLNPLGNGIQGFIVGNSQAGNQPSNLSLAAVLFYNAGHSTAQMHAIETFLGGEYGITIH